MKSALFNFLKLSVWFVTLLVGLSGCSISKTQNLPTVTTASNKLGNGTGFGGTEDLTLAIDLAKDHALEALRQYRLGNQRHFWGDLAYRGDSPIVRALLLAIASDYAKQNHLDTYLSNAANLDLFISALERSTFSITENDEDTRRNGEVQDALTQDHHVTFLRSRTEDDEPEEMVAKWIHEAGHMFGLPDEGVNGPFSSHRLFLTSLGVGGAAYYNGLHGIAVGGSGGSSPGLALMIDRFDRPDSNSPGDAWETISGAGWIRGGRMIPDVASYFTASTPNFSARNVSIRAYADFTNPGAARPWIHLGARRNAAGDVYTLGIGFDDLGMKGSLFLRRNGTWTELCFRYLSESSPVSLRKGQMALTVQGGNLSGSFRDTVVCSVENQTLTAAGKAFTFSHGIVMDNFIAEEL